MLCWKQKVAINYTLFLFCSSWRRLCVVGPMTCWLESKDLNNSLSCIRLPCCTLFKYWCQVLV